MGRVRREVSPPALSRWLRRRELLLLVEYIVQAGIAAPARKIERRSPPALAFALPPAVARCSVTVPLATVTLARCLPYLVRTEARARKRR